MTASTMTPVPLPEVIDALRAVTPSHQALMSVAQLRLLVDDIRSGRAIVQTLARPEFQEFTAPNIIDVVEHLGKYRARSRRQRAPKAMPVLVEANTADALFGYDKAMLAALGRAAISERPIKRAHLKAAPAEAFIQSEIVALCDDAGEIVDVLGFDEIVGAERYTVASLREIRLVPKTFGTRRRQVLLLLWTATPDSPLATAVPGQKIHSFRPADLVSKQGARGRRVTFPAWLTQSNVPLEVLLKETIIVPDGYSKEQCGGRDVSRSLAAIAVDDVDDAELVRFELSQQPPETVLAADHIGLLHWFVRHNLAYKLLEFAGVTPSSKPNPETGRFDMRQTGEPNFGLCRSIVDAFDVLDVARFDASEAMSTLEACDPSDALVVKRATTAASWVAPADIARIRDAAIAALTNPKAAAVLTRRVVSFQGSARSGRYRVPAVEMMTTAQTQLITVAAGLAVEGAEERAVRAEIRSKLADMGLEADAMRDIPAGVAAWRGGTLDAFYASRQARADGDPNWRDMLDVDVEQPVHDEAYA